MTILLLIRSNLTTGDRPAVTEAAGYRLKYPGLPAVGRR
jgi:hypothetical protein